MFKVGGLRFDVGDGRLRGLVVLSAPCAPKTLYHSNSPGAGYISHSTRTSNIRLQTSNPIPIHMLPEVILLYSKIVAEFFDGYQLARVFAV